MNKIKKLTKKQILYLTFIIIWMITVFAFSNQPAKESTKTSEGITNQVVNTVVKEPEKVSHDNKKTVETIIRKSAHVFLYFVGGILVINFIKTMQISTKKSIIYTLLFITIYASTDEIHQFFMDGRSCEITDVLIDTFGACLGIGSTFLLKTTKKEEQIK